MKKNNHNYDNFSLLSFIYSLFYFIFILIFLYLYINLEFEIFSVLHCDAVGNSTNPFIIDNEGLNSENNLEINPNLTKIYYINLYNKYKNISKRKIFWYFCESSRGNYINYNEYKKSWNPNIDILLEMKKQLKSEVLNNKHKLNVTKRSLHWYIKGSKPGGGRGL